MTSGKELKMVRHVRAMFSKGALIIPLESLGFPMSISLPRLNIDNRGEST